MSINNTALDVGYSAFMGGWSMASSLHNAAAAYADDPDLRATVAAAGLDHDGFGERVRFAIGLLYREDGDTMGEIVTRLDRKFAP